ncbi:MAG: sigma-70 family RNA polymerase sigma factor [Clostridia bacterium]|nr:sigma-70 family RNA polymerase sigma factor [Clostridia bacterium]
MRDAERFAEDYLGKLFYFALKKTGNESDADDLTQDIAEAVLAGLSRGCDPENFDAWVWAVARNRWKRWARRKYYGPEGSFADVDGMEAVLSDGEDMEASFVLSEDLMTLRRELAFIRRDYRQILVAHYFDNKSVSAIAREFSIPLGTVKTKLQSSRRKLKEGMEMARTFGKRSYQPENITFHMDGMTGDFGQPWSILTHLLYKNIFLEAYENPSTAEELALELGIALPYMEDELDYLVREELLKKSGNKYETAFRIYSREEQLAQNRAAMQTAKAVWPLLREFIDGTEAACRENGVDWYGGGISYENAKWAILTRTADLQYWEALEDLDDSPLPTRPDHGCWTITGYETVDFEIPPFVGQHGYVDPEDKNREHELIWSQYKFRYADLADRTPVHLTWLEALAIWQVAVGRAEECDPDALAKVMEYGYVSRDGQGQLTAGVVCFAGDPGKILKALPKSEENRLSELWNRAVELLKEKKARWSGYRSYILAEALSSGWLTYEEGKTPDTVGAYLYR